MCLLPFREKGNERKKGKREQATPIATSYTSYRLHRLLSFSRTNVFHLVSLPLSLSVFCLSLTFILQKKNSSLPSSPRFFLMNLGQHTSIIYILYNTIETSLLLLTTIITCGRYSIAINTNYLSCLCKTCTYANKKTRSIKIIIMALFNVSRLDGNICPCVENTSED